MKLHVYSFALIAAGLATAAAAQSSLEKMKQMRVATTDPVKAGGVSESLVTVLEDRAGTLTAVGEVSGLGRGERIYAVRFLGDVGYVVTFREVDPLYTLDLSDPTRPRVLGELKIPSRTPRAGRFLKVISRSRQPWFGTVQSWYPAFHAVLAYRRREALATDPSRSLTLNRR